jgi:hypothetical protein
MITPSIIKQMIDEIYGLDISNKTRKYPYPDLRKCYYYFAFKYCSAYTLESIASEVDTKHPNLLDGIKKLVNHINSDPIFQLHFNKINEEFIKKFADQEFYKQVDTLEEYSKLALMNINAELEIKKSTYKKRINSLKTSKRRLKNIIDKLRNDL